MALGQKESDVFEIFPWNRNFETGLEDIDEQHRVLVSILNRLAWHFASDASELSTEHILEELLAYAAYHFEYEETIWNEAMGGSDVARNHHDSHQMFFVRIQMFKQRDDPGEETLMELFDYLTRWLAFHILESDRRMALTVKALRDGLTMAEARERVDAELSGTISVLVNALLEIYGKLSALTIQLMREKMARHRAEEEVQRIQNERLNKALEQQASEYQKHLEALAYTDGLTGLWNRNGIIRAVNEWMDAEPRSDGSGVLIAIDLDNFALVNNLLGEDAADRLLGLLTRRWLDALPCDAVLARTGGDEFTVLLPDANQLESRLSALKLTANQRFDLDGHQVVLEFTAGIVLFPGPGAIAAETILRQAYHILYRAKQEAKGGWIYLDAYEQGQHHARQMVLAGIRRGLEDGEFRLYFQPKVNMHTGEVAGAEALIRWQHPEEGLLVPGRFLPQVEHHQLNIQLGEWVLQQALKQMSAWDKEGMVLNVGVNISAVHLQSDDFTSRLSMILSQYPQITPSRLDLEILETAALADLDKAVQVIKDCRALGVTFSLDDFGTGYSSLSYLQRLPVDTLKVDQSFVAGVEGNDENLLILKGVIGLSRAFGKTVIAEGVETVTQGQALLALGCEYAQGYAMSPPIPASQLPVWVSNWQPFPEWRELRPGDITAVPES
ncbi:diguanylate phosphodiesterase [Marinobacter fuscus]|uniref:Diguanylate phosphodiesterase n=2 Tax=Marinobacter fuscus TaxID=2109942 RepID=A0A2T1KAF8_9GAMM|nr:diguanylate phosphodiesterase [Marinobacter fuscus]